MLYSEGNIVESKAQILCFTSSTILKPKDIHGDNDALPMQHISALASTLYEFEPKLPLVLAGQFSRARLVFEQTKVFPMMRVQLEDGRFVSPFIVRRHHLDQIDNRLTIQSTDAIFRFILGQALYNRVNTIAIERPIDADDVYDKITGMLPDNITMYKEDRL